MAASATAPDSPLAPRESFAADLAGIPNFFIDPEASARCVHSKWFWVGPLILFSIVTIAASIALMPLVTHVLEIAPIPDGVDPGQYAKSMQMGIKIQSFTMYLAPVVGALVFALQALILFGASQIFTVRSTFRQMFNLISGCSVIQLLSSVASVIILKSKGTISTMAELRPALGFDIFLPEGTNKYLMGLAGYFSIFEIWWMVMLVLILSAAFKIDKGKAAVIAAPLVLLNLFWRVGAAAFQR